MKKLDLKKIILLSIFSALFVVAEIFTPEIGGFKISLSAIIIIVVAILYGALDAVIVAIIGGFVKELIGEYGLTVTSPLWMLPAIGRALIIGLFLHNVDFKKQTFKFIFWVVLSSIIVTALNTIVLYIDSKIFEYYTDELIYGTLLYRFLLGLGCSVIYILLCPLIIKPLRQYTKESDNKTNV